MGIPADVVVILPSIGSQIIFVCDSVVAFWLIQVLAPPDSGPDPEWGTGGMFN